MPNGLIDPWGVMGVTCRWKLGHCTSHSFTLACLWVQWLSIMGWFFGFKLHLTLNHQGQIMAFKITGGNTNDRQPLEPMTDELRGNVSAIRDTFPSH